MTLRRALEAEPQTDNNRRSKRKPRRPMPRAGFQQGCEQAEYCQDCQDDRCAPDEPEVAAGS